jgi:hypothetical protein
MATTADRGRLTGNLRNIHGACMKDIYEVLRKKELELSRLKKEVEALRVAAPLLSEGDEGDNGHHKPTLASSPAVNPTPQPDRSGGDDTATRW